MTLTLINTVFRILISFPSTLTGELGKKKRVEMEQLANHIKARCTDQAW